MTGVIRMNRELMIKKKTELGLTSEMISELSGVPLSTVQKVFSGKTKAPRKKTMEAIERTLLAEERKKADALAEVQRPAALVRESAREYGSAARKRIYTIDDYYALPEDQRVELIDGVFYDMGAPSIMHQFLLGDLFSLFRDCAREHNMPCEVFLSPCDVRLDRDDYTMVQPDLLVICHDLDLRAARYEGAPDLVAEILSPSSRSRDMVLKLHKYQNAGVREYWIIDPQYKEVTVHYFEADLYHPVIYGFDSQIPVGISGGECRIDFSGILKRLPEDL